MGKFKDLWDLGGQARECWHVSVRYLTEPHTWELPVTGSRFLQLVSTVADHTPCRRLTRLKSPAPVKPRAENCKSHSNPFGWWLSPQWRKQAEGEGSSFISSNGVAGAEPCSLQCWWWLVGKADPPEDIDQCSIQWRGNDKLREDHLWYKPGRPSVLLLRFLESREEPWL